MMSGGGMFPKFALPKKASETYGYWHELMDLAGCGSFEEFRNTDLQKIYDAYEVIKTKRKDSTNNMMPVIDGVLLKDSVDKLIGDPLKIDYMIGYTSNDLYAPMMAYIGKEGYAINFELRAGKQHCQSETVEFLQRTIALCRQLTDKPLLIRLDSGNDSIDNVAVLMENNCFFIIKRNLRRESKDGWFDMAKQYCKDVNTPREGKTVYIGSDWKTVTSKQFGKEFTLRAGYEITERTIDKYGQILMMPDIEVETWWTNLGVSDHDIISLYHAHGECEQYHSEVKTDMDLERLPSGKFETNALILELGMIAYNILRMIGQGTIGGRVPRQKREVKRRRLRTVIGNMVMLACHITTHARQLILGLGRSNVWRHVFMDFCENV
jgi:hypothetical protein